MRLEDLLMLSVTITAESSNFCLAEKCVRIAAMLHLEPSTFGFSGPWILQKAPEGLCLWAEINIIFSVLWKFFSAVVFNLIKHIYLLDLSWADLQVLALTAAGWLCVSSNDAWQSRATLLGGKALHLSDLPWDHNHFGGRQLIIVEFLMSKFFPKSRNFQDRL